MLNIVPVSAAAAASVSCLLLLLSGSLLAKGIRKQPRPTVSDQAGGLPLPASGLDGVHRGRCPDRNADDGVLPGAQGPVKLRAGGVHIGLGGVRLCCHHPR